MWVERSLNVWILLATASMPSTTVADFGFIQSMASALGSGAQYVIGAINPDKTDAAFIRQQLNSVLTKFTEIKWPCIHGLFYEVAPDESMKIWGGHLTQQGEENAVTTTLDVHNLQNAEKGFVTAVASFRISNIAMNYTMEYKGTMFYVSFVRDGSTRLDFEPVIIDIPVKQPDSKKFIEEQVKNTEKGTCLYPIPSQGIKIKTSRELNVNVEYESKHGTHYSMNTMKNILEKDMGDQLLKDMCHYVLMHVVNMVNGTAFNCLDEEAARKWKLPDPKEECDEIKTMTHPNP